LFSQFAGMDVRGIEVRLTTRIWFWFLAIPLLAVGSFAVSFGLFAALDRTLGPTSMNVWGDMEGLIVAVWVGAAILFVLGFAVLIRWGIGSGLRLSRDHSSDEFGQMPSQAIKGLDPPMIGAPVSITLAGIVERESWATPSPPVVSVNAIVIALVVMVIVGLAILIIVPVVSPPPVMP
jgi:hypothetical protein